MILNLLKLEMFFISKSYTFVGKEITIFQQQPMCRVEFRWRKKGKKSRCSKMAAVYYEKKEGKQWTLKNGLSRH